ncbi:MAG: hypothetical protein Q9227_003802 [Pyrenula ochraceoflavens]
MPTIQSEGRFSCEQCIKGHRTGECNCFETRKQKEILQLHSQHLQDAQRLAQACGGQLALFEKTQKQGRPDAETKKWREKYRTLFAVVKIPTGNQECQHEIVRELVTDRATGQVVPERPPGGCCSSKRKPDSSIAATNDRGHQAGSCCSSKSKSSLASQPNKQAKSFAEAYREATTTPMQIGSITSNASNRGTVEHQCHCGEGCSCTFCPVHPNNESTRQQISNMVQQGLQIQYGSQLKSEASTSNIASNSTQRISLNVPTNQTETCTGPLQPTHQLVFAGDREAAIGSADNSPGQYYTYMAEVLLPPTEPMETEYNTNPHPHHALSAPSGTFYTPGDQLPELDMSSDMWFDQNSDTFHDYSVSTEPSNYVESSSFPSNATMTRAPSWPPSHFPSFNNQNFSRYTPPNGYNQPVFY